MTRRPQTARVRWAAALAAAAPAAAYVLIDPPSRDLAAQLYRAQLFSREGLGLWDNGWYSGHHVLGYSVLFPAVGALLGPPLAAALAAVATAAVFAGLAVRHFGERAIPGVLLFAAATAIDLYTGRLALAFGALPALASVAVLDRGRTVPAAALAALAALCSPVAGLFAAVGGAGYALGDRRPGGWAVALAALAPIGLLAVAFPEGGTEPFGVATLIGLLAICAGALAALPPQARRLRAGVGVYVAVSVAAFVIPSPLGANVARLGALMAAPLAALIWWRRRTALLALLIVPLLYVGWQAPVADVSATAQDPSLSARYYRPLLDFLHAQAGVFRIEIPFTASHWEAYWVAGVGRVPLARGWERQLDIGENPLFYRGRLTAAAYARWLHASAVRYVAVPDVALDPSARAEAALIKRRPGFLAPVMRSAHWQVYAVADPTPIASGVASLRSLGPDRLSLDAGRPGSTLLHIHFTPFWALTRGRGCVLPAGNDTRVVTAAGPLTLSIRFSPGRIGARSARCTPGATERGITAGGQ